MMDFQAGLPTSIHALGEDWELQTDFRYWIDYPERMKRVSEGEYDGYIELFKGDVPTPCAEVAEALNSFFYTPSEIPRGKSGGNFLSFKYDSDYIFAGFKQAYGIDLMDEPLHWHKFLALLMSLPEDTMMTKIIGYRSYNGNSKTPGHAEYMRLKSEWSLPVEYTEEEQAEIEKFDALFG